MIEIMGKIVLCLLIALLIGFIVGWLFSKAFRGEQDYLEEEHILENENQLKSNIAELAMKYEKEKQLVADYANRNRELKGELMKKMSLLQSNSDRLKTLQSNGEDGSNLEEKVLQLRKLLEKKDRELIEFETVLVKAEETIKKLSDK
jgi:uncharacterized membrane protein YraQ (UPF0718 family)